ncbi:hypothetical protein, partial [Jatrophihabitans sp.]|uniref:hypothetical protein n=1 Tax=Jatrophihabitans sp. TaxID=1932789 RepID=UPI002EDCD984
MTELPGLQELAKDALTLLGATAVAVRGLDSDGATETLALAGRNAAALFTDQDEPATSVRGRWRRREPAGPGEQESHPITGSSGQQLGWLMFERGPAGTGRLGE